MSLEQIKMDLEEDIARNKYRVEAWKNITYLTKKNGSLYKQNVIPLSLIKQLEIN